MLNLECGVGCVQDRSVTRAGDAMLSFTNTAFVENTQAPDYHVQTVAWIRNQRRFPSCVGFSFAACIDAKIAEAGRKQPWVSAVSIWREARRRQGRIERIDKGTRLEYAVAGLVNRGWDDWEGPEEDMSLEEASRQDDLADELFAHDKRMSTKHQRYRITQFGNARLQAVVDALFGGFGVVLGTGLREPFFVYKGGPDVSDLTLGEEYIGGGERGHAMRVFGYDATGDRWRFLIQNSWGEGWGGAHAGDGYMPGVAWVDEQAITRAWDIHVFQPRI